MTAKEAIPEQILDKMLEKPSNDEEKLPSPSKFYRK